MALQAGVRRRHAAGGHHRGGGVYALRHNVERLAEDHENARTLAHGLAELPGISMDPSTVETNLVFFDVAGTGLDAEQWVAALLEHGIRMGAMGPTLVRAVTHLDVDRDGIRRALAAAGALARTATTASC